MGAYVAVDNAGNPYRIKIFGETPNEVEMQRINAFLAEKNAKLPKPEEPPVEGGLGRWGFELGKSAIREGIKGVTTVPMRAVGGIGDYLVGNEDPGLLTRTARRIDEGFDYNMGPAPGYEGGYADTIGSLAGMMGSFIVPGAAAGKLASAGLKGDAALAAARKAMIGTELGLGVATGASEAGVRADRYENQTGQKVSVEDRAIASMIGGALGSSFVLPLERIATPLAKLLRFVPEDRKTDVVRLLADRLKDAAAVGGVGAAQNLVYGIGQDLIEKGLYNPELDPTKSVMQNIVAGGSVPALLHFAIGRSLNQRATAGEQLTGDLAAEAEKAQQLNKKMEGEQVAATARGAEQVAVGAGAAVDQANRNVGRSVDEAVKAAAESQLAETQRQVAEATERLDPRNQHFTKAEPGNFSIKQTASGRWFVEDHQGGISGDPAGPKAKATYATQTEAAMAAERLQAQLAEKKAAEAKAAGLKTEAELALEVAKTTQRGGEGVPFELLDKTDQLRLNAKLSRGGKDILAPGALVRRSALTDILNYSNDQASEILARTSPGKSVDGAVRVVPTQPLDKVVMPPIDYGPRPDLPLPLKTELAERQKFVQRFGSDQQPESSTGERVVEEAPKDGGAPIARDTVEEIGNKSGLSLGDFAINEEVRYSVPSKKKGRNGETLRTNGRGSIIGMVGGKLVVRPLQGRSQDLHVAPDFAWKKGGAPITASSKRMEGTSNKAANKGAGAAREGGASSSTEKSDQGQPPQKPKIPDLAPITSNHPVFQRLVNRLNQVVSNGKPALVVKRWIDNEAGKPDAGLEGKYDPRDNAAINAVVELAEGHLKPGMSEEQIFKALARVMDHEIIHHLKRLGVFSDNEWGLLQKYVENKFVPGKRYTYMQRAQARDPNAIPERIFEEAIADAFADFASGELKAGGVQAGWFRRIVNFFKAISGWLDPTKGGAELMERIRSGDIGRRSPLPDQKKTNDTGVRNSRLTRDEFSNLTDLNMIKSGRYSRLAAEPLSASESGFTEKAGKTPHSQAEILASISSRVDYTLANPVKAINDMKYAAASDMLADLIKPVTRAFDRRKMYLDSAAGRAFTPYRPSERWLGENEQVGYLMADDRARYYADKITKALTDKMIGLARMIDTIKDNGGSVLDSFDAYAKHDAINGKTLTEIKDNQIKIYQPIFDSIYNLGYTADDVARLMNGNEAAKLYLTANDYPNSGILGLYLYARHAIERNAVLAVINPKGKALIDEDTGSVKRYIDENGEEVIERSGKAGLSGMTTPEARDIISKLQGMDNFGKLLDAELKFRKLIANTNEVRVRGELIPPSFSPDTMDTTMAQAFRVAADSDPELAYLRDSGYAYYAPLRGFAEDVEGVVATRASKGKSLQFIRRQDQRALGRTSVATKVLEHALLQNEEAIMRANYADAGRAFLKMIEENIGKDGMKNVLGDFAEIMAKAPVRNVLVNGVYTVQVNIDGQNINMAQRGPHVATMIDPEFRSKMYEPDNPVYMVRRYERDENGVATGKMEEVYLRINDYNLRRALKGTAGLGSNTLERIIGHMGKMTRFLANTVTSWNPEFMFLNWPRDVSEALINAGQYEDLGIQKEVLKNVVPAAKAIWAMTPEARLSYLTKGVREASDDVSGLTEQQLFMRRMNREFSEDGGYVAFHGMKDLADTTSKIHEGFKDPANFSTVEKSWNQVRRLGDFIEAYNTAVENSTRLAIYTSLRKALESRGVPEAQARRLSAYASKNVNANFNRGGEWKTAMNSLFMFYNASMQGSFAVATAARRSPYVRKMIAGIALAGFLNDSMNSMMSDTDPDGTLTFDKVKDWQLQNRMVFMDPFGMTERGYIAIPMPYGFSAFYNFGRSFSRALRGGYEPGEAMASALGGIVNSFNPITGSHSLANFVAPTVVDPIVDIYGNKDYKNDPIYKQPSQYGVQAPSSQLHWNNTSAPSIAVADFVNQLTGGSMGVSGKIDISPDTIDYLAGFLTGGVGRFIGRVTDVGWDAATGNFNDIEFNDVPVVRALGGQVSERNDVERYMDLRERVLQPYNAAKHAAENGDARGANQLRQQYSMEMRLAGVFKDADATRNRLTSQLRKIRENQNLKPEQKARLEDSLKKMIAKQEERAISAFNRMKEQQ